MAKTAKPTTATPVPTPVPGELVKRTDEDYMRLALRLARKAAEAGEVPVGAVVVAEGRILARAWNQVELLKDATAHAEMIALTQAENALGNWRLTGATLYVTKEPCVMCAGAMVNSRLTRLVFGCADPRCGAAGSALNVTNFPGLLHRVEVTGGVLADDCLTILRQFFQERRQTTNTGEKTQVQNPPEEI